MEDGLLDRILAVTAAPRVARLLLEFFPGRERLMEMRGGEDSAATILSTPRMGERRGGAGEDMEEVGASGDSTPGATKPSLRRGGRGGDRGGGDRGWGNEQGRGGGRGRGDDASERSPWKRFGERGTAGGGDDGSGGDDSSSSSEGSDSTSSSRSLHPGAKSKAELQLEIMLLQEQMNKLVDSMAKDRVEREEKDKADDRALDSVFQAFDRRVKDLEDGGGGATSGLTSKVKKRLVNQVVASLDLDEFATKDQLTAYIPRAEVNQPSPGTTLHHLLGMGSKVGALETAVRDPAGLFKRLERRVETLEQKRHANAVEFGGVVFKDAQSTNAWFQMLGDPEAYCFCPDFVTLLSTTNDSVTTISEGLKANADAIRAGFETVTGAEATITCCICTSVVP